MTSPSNDRRGSTWGWGTTAGTRVPIVRLAWQDSQQAQTKALGRPGIPAPMPGAPVQWRTRTEEG